MKQDFKESDRVIGIKGTFEGKKGEIVRINGESACVVWRDVWDFGIWVFFDEIKRTKRYREIAAI